MIGQQEQQLFRVGDFQPGGAEQQINAPILIGLWVELAVDEFLQHQDALGVVGQVRVFDNSGQQGPLPVKIAGDDQLAGGLQPNRVAAAAVVFGIDPGGVSEDVGNRVGHDL